MQSVSIQWENRNELRRHPFEQSATLVSDDGARMPHGIVADIHLSYGGTGLPYASCVHVGPVVSIAVAFSDAGSPLLHLSIPFDEIEPYRPYPMLPFSDSSGAAGLVSFGNVSDLAKYRDDPTTWRFSSADQSGILPTCVLRVPGGQLLSFVDDRTGETVSGDVVIRVPDGISVSKSEGATDAGVPAAVASFSLSDALNERLKTDCDADGLASVKRIQPIRSFNFVRPNEKGEIAIILN